MCLCFLIASLETNTVAAELTEVKNNQQVHQAGALCIEAPGKAHTVHTVVVDTLKLAVALQLDEEEEGKQERTLTESVQVHLVCPQTNALAIVRTLPSVDSATLISLLTCFVY